MGEIDSRIAKLGLALPPATKPVANYVPYVITGNLVVISGQITMGANGPEHVGKLGAGLDVAAGKMAARQCALNVLAQLKAALDGDLDRVHRCVRIGGFVNATPDFIDHPAVVNGASDLIAEVFGARGQHARSAFGVSSLPFGVAVEIEAMFEIT